MTPAVFCVHADTPAAKVVDKMLALNVRRLFVVDDEGALVQSNPRQTTRRHRRTAWREER